MKLITELALQPYSFDELCHIYQIDARLMRLNLLPIAEKIGKRIGHKYNIEQVIIIVEHLDMPAPFQPFKNKPTKIPKSTKKKTK